MQIVKGNLFINKTVKYLFPALQVYGTSLAERLMHLGILAIGIHDSVLDDTPYEENRKLCILIDRSVNPRIYEDSLNWITYQSYYLVHYSYGGIMSYYTMIVLSYPEQYTSSYDKFLEGKYSEMYSKEDVEKFFPTTNSKNPVLLAREHAREVITGRLKAKQQFAIALNKAFNTNLDPKEIEGEYDFPLSKEQEIFNYNKQ